MHVNIGGNLVEFPDSMTEAEITQVLDAAFKAKDNDITELIATTMATIASMMEKTAQETQTALAQIVESLPDSKPIINAMNTQNEVMTRALSKITDRLSSIPSAPEIVIPETDLSPLMDKLERKPVNLAIKRDKNGMMERVVSE